MKDKYFDIDEAMIDYAEMTSFNFNSSDYRKCSNKKYTSEKYLNQQYTFKYGTYDILDMLKSMISKATA